MTEKEQEHKAITECIDVYMGSDAHWKNTHMKAISKLFVAYDWLMKYKGILESAYATIQNTSNEDKDDEDNQFVCLLHDRECIVGRYYNDASLQAYWMWILLTQHHAMCNWMTILRNIENVSCLVTLRLNITMTFAIIFKHSNHSLSMMKN
eukprot:1002513_1